MTPAQCRPARALLDISIDELHGSSVVPRVIIEAFETDGAKLRQADLDAIQHSLERAGIGFIDGDRPGLRLRK